MNGLTEFASRHWIIGGIAASLLWLLGGMQYSDSSPGTAAAWQSIAVIIVITVTCWTVLEKEWIGFAAALLVGFIEVRELRSTARLWLRGN